MKPRIFTFSKRNVTYSTASGIKSRVYGPDRETGEQRVVKALSEQEARMKHGLFNTETYVWDCLEQVDDDNQAQDAN